MQEIEHQKTKKGTQRKTYRVTISINKTVKDFALRQLKKSGGFTPTEVYKSVRSGRGLLSQESRRAVALIDNLLLKIPTFVVTLPHTRQDDERMKTFVKEWKDHVCSLRTQLLAKSQPIYYHTEVDKELQKLGSQMRCRDIHLEWYLSRYGVDEMTPEKIAAAIVEHDGTIWKKVPHLVKDARLMVSLAIDTPNARKKALSSILWLYRIPTATPPTSIISAVENDLKVIEDFDKWISKSPLNYDYQAKYNDLKSQLQTSPKVQQTTPPSEVRQPAPSESNIEKLVAYLEEIATTKNIHYLSSNIAEERNKDYLKEFANNPDFGRLFRIMKEKVNTIPKIEARQIMGFVRDVVIRQATDWNF